MPKNDTNSAPKNAPTTKTTDSSSTVFDNIFSDKSDSLWSSASIEQKRSEPNKTPLPTQNTTKLVNPINKNASTTTTPSAKKIDSIPSTLKSSSSMWDLNPSTPETKSVVGTGLNQKRETAQRSEPVALKTAQPSSTIKQTATKPSANIAATQGIKQPTTTTQAQQVQAAPKIGTATQGVTPATKVAEQTTSTTVARTSPATAKNVKQTMGTSPAQPRVQQTQVQPVRAQQAQTRPVQAQQTQARPVQAQQTQVQPTKAQPVQAQQTQVQPTKAQPVRAQQAQTIPNLDAVAEKLKTSLKSAEQATPMSTASAVIAAAKDAKQTLDTNPVQPVQAQPVQAAPRVDAVAKKPETSLKSTEQVTPKSTASAVIAAAKDAKQTLDTNPVQPVQTQQAQETPSVDAVAKKPETSLKSTEQFTPKTTASAVIAATKDVEKAMTENSVQQEQTDQNPEPIEKITNSTLQSETPAAPKTAANAVIAAAQDVKQAVEQIQSQQRPDVVESKIQDEAQAVANEKVDAEIDTKAVQDIKKNVAHTDESKSINFVQPDAKAAAATTHTAKPHATRAQHAKVHPTKATRTPLTTAKPNVSNAPIIPEEPEEKLLSGVKDIPDANQAGFGQLSPSEVDFIPSLLRSLSSLMRLRGKTISAQYLYAGLAGVGEVTPGECLRAAGRAGLQAKILPRASIEEISTLTLPCILLLKDGKSCVLTAYSRQVATVIFPESGEDPQQVSLATLSDEYSGYAAFGSIDKKADKRIDTFRRERGKGWFWDAIKHYGPIYRHAAFASVIINLIALGSPLFVMNVYDRVVPNHALETLWVLALGVTIAYLFDFLLRTLRNYFVDTAGRNADVVISSMLVDKVLTMQMDHKPESTGALVNNVREFESLREFFSSSTLLSCIDLPFLVLFLLCLGFIGGPLVLLPLIAMPVMFGIGVLLQSLAKRAAEKSYAQSMHKNALLTEMVNGLETLKCCQGENRMQRVWETVVESSAQANAETKKYGSLAVGFSVFITQFVTVGMVVWGVYLIAEGTLTMGGLIGSNILAGRAMAPLMQMAGLITRFQNSRISLDALNILMALPSEDRQDQASVDFGPLESSFTFEGVSFAYPHAARTAVENLSLHIAPGEKVGIIGRMGSGKSTLIRLLIGLYQPKDGAVKFGNVDIRQLAGADLRARVGFAPQDTVLFYGSIRDNIVLGDPSVNDLRTIRAANLSGVIEFVRANPEGFGAQVGEQGKALSGGQRQAIGLARALVRDPEVLILDEPTSNMDTSSEQAVQARLTKIVKNKTLILVTHRMSMLKMVDRLIVMDSGRIVADGPKEEVIQKLRAASVGAAQGMVNQNQASSPKVQAPKTKIA